MVSSDLIFGMAFFFQCAIGIVGNSILLMLYVFIYFKKPQQKKPMDLILAHLTLANMISLLTRGIPEIMFSFGMRHILDDLGSKLLMYIYRISRGLSTSTTSLLSMFQAFIISPNKPMWASIKIRAPRYILYSFSFFWVINALIYIRVLEIVEAPKNITITSLSYISNIYMSRKVENDIPAFILAMILHDLTFHFLLGLTSIYMVLILYRHSKQVQHIHSTLSIRSFPEAKATQTILLIVSCFVLFYWINNYFTVYLCFQIEKQPVYATIASFFSGCYPALSPLLLIGRENRISKFYCRSRKAQKPHTNFVDTLFNP
ncbi:olfactory receptor class A-like protein 1 [Macrotis lagotis]|uniref:olfactory receptor class A-like protein 1 n=1 Tax=Macrotis lagotis TaxID=92651 RepID=UPI003D691850